MKLLSIPEVARSLAVSRQTVYNYIRGGPKYEGYWVLQYIRLPGGQIRVSEAQLERFIRENTKIEENKAPR